MIRSSDGANAIEEGFDGWEVCGVDLTFFDQVKESEFEGTEVVSLVDGEEEATEGNFDEF